MSKSEAQQVMEDLGASKVVQLKTPFTNGEGVLVESVTVRRLRVKDLRTAAHAYPGQAELQELYLQALSCGLVQEDFDLMTYKDAAEVRLFCFG